jgi:riboflavin synthase
MFTGISECTGVVVSKTPNLGGFDFVVQSPISSEFKIDQSICHDGICLTVVDLKAEMHTVQAIAETVSKTNIAQWNVGRRLNIERSMPASGRFDGHIVQGHVDSCGTVIKTEDADGQWVIWIEHTENSGITVQKGSICVNGISLTVVESQPNGFSVAIIPYTRINTNLGSLVKGDLVNIEFDIIGKYLKKYADLRV